MDVGQLKTLIHVAELGSLSKAADRLHIAQPALSRQIRLLEKELGVQLFDRHGRGMMITDAGREVLSHATRVMTELELIRSAVSVAPPSYHGTVMVGMTPTVAEIVTVPLVRKIKELHPHLGLRFSSAFTGHLLDWLQRGELDIAVSYDPAPLPSLRIIPIMMENLLVVSAGKKRLKLSRSVPFASLADEKLILPSPRHGLRAIMEGCARRAGIALRATIEADSFSAMIDLVRSGFGSTVLPLAPIHKLVECGALCAAPLTDPAPERKLVVVYPADRAVSPSARFVGETFTEIAGDLVGRGVWAGRMLGRKK
jgi:LysR family nitrogen assimilation transcriptional regulator